MRAGDTTLLVLSGAVCFYFLLRWVVRRRRTSLFTAFVPAGWVLLALEDLGLIAHQSWYPWAGVAIAVFLLIAAVRTEATEGT